MITYSSEGVKFPNIKKRETSNWIKEVAATYGKKIGEIGYMFVNDDKILEVNNEFLGHDYYTDIITFDYSEGKVLNGDLYISLDTVFTNADKFGRPYDEERQCDRSTRDCRQDRRDGPEVLHDPPKMGRTRGPAFRRRYGPRRRNGRIRPVRKGSVRPDDRHYQK